MEGWKVSNPQHSATHSTYTTLTKEQISLEPRYLCPCRDQDVPFLEDPCEFCRDLEPGEGFTVSSAERDLILEELALRKILDIGAHGIPRTDVRGWIASVRVVSCSCPLGKQYEEALATMSAPDIEAFEAFLQGEEGCKDCTSMPGKWRILEPLYHPVVGYGSPPPDGSDASTRRLLASEATGHAS